MKKQLSLLALTSCLAMSSLTFADTTKTVVVVNPNQNAITFTYSLCDESGNFCEMTQTTSLQPGERLVIKK